MKKISAVTLATITILTLLFSFLPLSTALATKEVAYVTLKVTNRTGGKVMLLLINENGKRLISEYETGLTNTILSEGRFHYYVRTISGNQSGSFNLNITKDLFFSCGTSLEVALVVPVRTEACMHDMTTMPVMPEMPSNHCHPMTHPE